MSITLKTVTSGYNLSTINANFQSLQAALNNNILWRTGSVAGEAQMSRDLDMDGHYLLNVGVDVNNPGSLLTMEVADARYYNITGDTLQGNLDSGGFRLTNIGVPQGINDAIRRAEIAPLEQGLLEEVAARQSADANIQDQLTGNTPLEASNFSPIAWHVQEIANSVTIPDNRNAWSFGPQMEISAGQLVTVGEGSSWTIANGRVVENEDLHALIADTITTSSGGTTVSVADLATNSDILAVQTQVSSNTANIAGNSSDIASLTTRMGAEETKVQGIALGGTGATTATAARSNLGAAASGANTDITSITGSAATLTTARTLQTNLASTTAASFNGSANNVHGVTGVLPVANGGTGGATAGAARTALGAAASAGVVDGSDAAVGAVGEFLSTTSTAVALTTTNPINAASLALTAGDWDVDVLAEFVGAAGCVPTQLRVESSTTSATFAGFGSGQLFNATFGTATTNRMAGFTQRYSITTNTTIYCVAQSNFTGGTQTVRAVIRARRVR